MFLDWVLRVTACTYYAFVDSPPILTEIVTENVFPALNDAVVIL
jgi:hypothetical protein